MGSRVKSRGASSGWTIGRLRPLVLARTWSVLALLVVVAVGLGLSLWPRSAPVAQAMPLAPNFSLPAASSGGASFGPGGTLSLRSLRGRPVLINFFESTCAACLDEMPVLRQAARAYHKQGLVVVGVATFGDSAGAAHRLASAAHLPYPVVVDNQATAWRYGVAAVPTSFFVDAKGRLAGQYIGQLDGQTVRNGLAQVGAIKCRGCAALEPVSIDAAPASSTTFSADVTYSPPMKAAPFALRDQRGRVVTPLSLRGKAVALTFISAQCKEQCPLIGQTLSAVRRQLGPDAKRLAIVAISVDPEIDSPAATLSFARESGWLGADWHYLTATRSVLSRIWTAYGMDVPQPSPIFKPGQTIVHQAGLFLLDEQGRVRAYYDTPFFAPRVAATVRALLASE